MEGILVPESANNASVGGSLVPLLSLGIPGSAAAAVLACGLMAQGLTPGPQLMEKNPEIAYAFIVSMIIANIGMLLIGYLLVRVCTRILDVPKLLIIPAVISISFLGAYALRNSMFDVLLMILSGGIAYLLLKAKIMPAGIALGLVLGRIIEENLIVTLYRTQAEDSLIFGSELKTLLAHPAVPPRIDANGLAEVLLLGPGRTPGCGVFQNVRELLPGQYAVYETQTARLTLHTYWRLEDHDHPDDFTATARRVRDLVTDAIERQLVSDVPVATFLSGGLDSSLISAIADAHFTAQGNQLQTFSVGYRDNKKYFHATKFQPGADAPYIRKMNDFLHARHHWVTLDTPELVPALYAAVDARDLPGMADVDASLLVFCRHIKPHATVALSGECADEIFGGYPWYRDPTVRERYGFPWAQSTAYRASFIKPGVLGGIDPAAFVDERYRATLAQTSVRPGLPAAEQRMRQMMNLNFKWFMQTLLDRKDRMSMYSGLEVRVPFCDYRIAEYLYSVPWEFKDYHGQEKGLLREAMRGVLPDEVLWRRKSPYPKTWNPSYLAAVSAELRTVLNDPAAPLLRIIRADALETLLASGADNPIPWYGQLMTTPQTIAWFLQLNYWLAKYKVELV